MCECVQCIHYICHMCCVYTHTHTHTTKMRAHTMHCIVVAGASAHIQLIYHILSAPLSERIRFQSRHGSRSSRERTMPMAVIKHIILLRDCLAMLSRRCCACNAHTHMCIYVVSVCRFALCHCVLVCLHSLQEKYNPTQIIGTTQRAQESYKKSLERKNGITNHATHTLAHTLRYARALCVRVISSARAEFTQKTAAGSISYRPTHAHARNRM